MEKLIRGYTLKDLVYENDYVSVYNAEHSILASQKQRVSLLNEKLVLDSSVKYAFNSSIFKLSFAEHDYIIKNIDMLEENDDLVILSEYGEFEYFYDRIENFSNHELIDITIKVLTAVDHLNSRNIYVTDLKPEHIYIDVNGNPRISNYGLTDIFLNSSNEEVLEQIKERALFCAPERLKPGATSSDRTEVYTCGVLINYLFGKHSVFEASKLENLDGLAFSLGEIVSKATSSNQYDRYKSVKHLLESFNACISLIPDEKIDGVPTFVEPVSHKTEKSTEDFVSTDIEDHNLATDKYSVTERETIQQEIKNKEDVVNAKNYKDLVADIEKQKQADAKRKLQIAEEIERQKKQKQQDILEQQKQEQLKQKQQQQQQQREQQQQTYNNSRNQQTQSGFAAGTQNTSQAQTEQKTSQAQSNQNAYTQHQQKTQNTYNTQQNRQTNYKMPPAKVNTANVVGLGVLSIIFSFIFSVVGFVVAIFGLSRIGKNNKKLRSLKRKYTSSEKNLQTIGTVLCVFGLLSSLGRIIMFFARVFG